MAALLQLIGWSRDSAAFRSRGSKDCNKCWCQTKLQINIHMALYLILYMYSLSKRFLNPIPFLPNTYRRSNNVLVMLSAYGIKVHNVLSMRFNLNSEFIYNSKTTSTIIFPLMPTSPGKLWFTFSYVFPLNRKHCIKCFVINALHFELLNEYDSSTHIQTAAKFYTHGK
jgi:hypothetical protein